MTAKEAQNILELEAPFTVVELKSAHKNALVAWFPAQFMSDRAQLTKALERTAQIHEAYDVLLAHCEAEKEAAANPFVEEALKQAYGQALSPPSRAESQPHRTPVLEPQTPAPLEPLPQEEGASGASLNPAESTPAASHLQEPEQEGDAPASLPEPASLPTPPAQAANPFLHEIVPLKVTSEAPKVELRGKAIAPLEAPTPAGANTLATAPLSPRTDSAITKVRPPKVIISPRLRGATLQPAMPVSTVPVPVAPLSEPIPAVAPLPPPPTAPVIQSLAAPAPVEQPVKAEAPAPALTPVPVEPEPTSPVVEPEAKVPEPALAPVVAPAVAEVAPPLLEPSSEPEAKAPEPEATPALTPEPPAPVEAEAPVVTPEPEAAVTTPALMPAAEEAETPEAPPAPQVPEPVPAQALESISKSVEKPEVSAAEIPPPPSRPAILASPEPVSSAALAPAEPAVPAEPAHGIPAVIAEEASAVEQAAHHAPSPPATATSPVAAVHPANQAPAPIARPHPHAPASGKTKTDAEAEADDPPASDHALVPVLGDRYHPAEKEASPNTDTTRHFPTRPFAPSSGTSPIHDEGKSSAAPSERENRSPDPAEPAAAGEARRPLSVGQRILRFVLAVVCVGGVGYGIYLVSQTNLGRDPWGKEPGSGGPIDRLNLQVLESLKRDAEDGIARAQFDLAKAYQHGKGLKENPEEALKWFRKAAEQGHMDAQYAVGDAYKNGRGVPQDNAEALKWYRMAEATREEQRGSKKEKGKEEEEDLRLQ